MRINGLLLGLFLLFPLLSLGQTVLPYPVKQQYFQLPNDLGPDDYVPGVLVVRVSEAYQDLCSPTGINIPGFERYTNALEVTKIVRSLSPYRSSW